MDCKEIGHTSYKPSPRACKKCAEAGIKCHRLLAMSIVSDCEEGNKKELESMMAQSQSGTLPDNLEFLVATPDPIHVVKTLKCSVKNWWI